MQVNDVIELEIDSMSYGASAVGRYALGDGQTGKLADGSREQAAGAGAGNRVVVFVQGAMPGEKVRARVSKKHKNYWEAALVEVLRPSADRVAPPCPVFEQCGGCQWQFMSYDAQIRAKEDILTHQLHRTARLALDEIKKKLTTHPAKNPLGYRARLQAHGDAQGMGFFGTGSHSIVRTDRCIVAHPDIQKAWTEFLAKRPIAELARARGQFKIEWTRTDNGQVREALNSKHGAFGFTQVNSEQNEVLKKLVSKLAGEKKRVLLDLYGGDGNLSKQLSGNFEHVICVDSFNDGGAPTKVDPKANSGFVLVNARVEDFLENQYWRDWGFEQIDCVIADPPRNGLREAAGRIADLQASRIVLVSCDPSTLARDLTAFTAASYEVDQIHLVDMFPQTFHLETVVSLVKKS